MSNGFQTTSDHNRVCDVLAGRAHVQIGFLSNCNRTHTQTVQAKPPKKAEKFPQIFHSPLGVRRTVKSSTGAVVAESLHPNEKPLSAELRRYHGLGVDAALLQLGFNAADLDHMLFT